MCGSRWVSTSAKGMGGGQEGAGACQHMHDACGASCPREVSAAIGSFRRDSLSLPEERGTVFQELSGLGMAARVASYQHLPLMLVIAKSYASALVEEAEASFSHPPSSACSAQAGSVWKVLGMINRAKSLG